MIHNLLLAAAIAQAAPRAPAVIEVPDDRVVQLGGKDSLLILHLDKRFYNDASNRAALMRIGLDQGCPLYHWAVNVAVAKNRAQFRPLLIAEMRETIPATDLNQSPYSTGLWGNLARFRPAVETGLQDSARDVFARLEGDFSVSWMLASKALPAAPAGTAQSVFGDWDLERPLALQGACMLIGRGGPDAATLEQRKTVFDQFFKKGAK